MADQYALGAARVSVAQLADDVGFDSMHTSSYAILSELLMRYMEEVGLASHGYAELASRTEPNALDVVRVFVMGGRGNHGRVSSMALCATDVMAWCCR